MSPLPSDPDAMSHHQSQPSRDIVYDPLPLEQENGQDTLYNAPSSPGPASPSTRYSEFHTPAYDPVALPADRDSHYLPPGAGVAQPRFLGAAFYDDGTPHIRDSYASSQASMPYQQSDANSSVYALNAGGATTHGQRDSFAGSYRDDPREAYYGEQVPIGSLSQSHGKYLGDKRGTYAAAAGKKRKSLILAVIGTILVVIIAIALILYFAVFKKKGDSSSGAGASSSSAGASPTASPQSALKTGGNGSKVTMDDGTTFTYVNSFGGYWYWDENDPFNNSAKVNSWTPALNETFEFGVDRIWGYDCFSFYLVLRLTVCCSVNLGGWLTTEPVSIVAHLTLYHYLMLDS